MKIKIVLIGMLFTLVFTRCTTEYMEIQPATLIEEEYYKNPENVYMAVIGCYDVLAWDSKHNSIPYFFGDIMGRDSYKGGDIGGDQPWMDGLIDFTYNSTNEKLDILWTNYYIGINRSNKLIENMDNTNNLTDEDKNRYLAEAHFLRGYYHFELVKYFGEVPMVDHLLNPDEYITQKNSKEELFELIESDFDFAAEHLPFRSEIASANEFGRASKGAARAMLAKAHAYQNEWQEVATLTNDIIESGEYELLDNYSDIFQLSNEHNKEIVFEIEFKDQLNEYGNESNGNMFTIYMQGRDHTVGGAAGWGFNCPTQDFADEFETGDTRLDATVITNGEILYEGTADEEIYNMDDAGYYASNFDKMLNQKYHIRLSEQATYGMDQPKNWIVCRYAQVLLWNAEAKAHLNGDWETPLQEVRDRAGLGPTPFSDPLTAIYHEMRVELGMEGHRFWEVVRQGRGEQLFGEYGFIEGVHNHFPIPQTQLDLNGGNF